LLNLLSIDVALGAVSCSFWIASICGVSVSVLAYCLLGFTVWLVYTVDHLADARRLTVPAATRRHAFHQQHYKSLILIVILLVLLNAVVLIVTPAVMYYGMILLIIILLYLFLNRWLVLSKEIIIGILYVCGVCVPALSYGGGEELLNHYMVVIGFLLTVFLNLILFSWYDYPFDVSAKNPSIAVVLGYHRSKSLLIFLFVIQGILLAWGAFHLLDKVILLIMNAVLLMLFLRPQVFAQNERFRLWGDAVFLLPALFKWAVG
jgi:4-hydroxybenzoate polyprenyltransferase